jgi:GNAT superfamily N-acetyltransferase
MAVMNISITPLRETAGERLAWLATASPDGRPVGTAFAWMPPDGGGAAELQVRVHPAERRAGVGTRLLDAVVAAARERGLSGVLSEHIEEGTPGELFCVARGLRRVLTLIYTRLPLDGPLPVAVPAAGYRLIHWEGVVADALAETFARSRRAMDDMPMDEAPQVPEVWDVDRLHRIADAVAGRGDVLRTTAAVDADGEIVGFSELVVSGDGTGDGQHYGTGVLGEHRGRGLAAWMKAAQIAAARERFPRLSGLLADTAESNTAMRRVNETLGYRPTHRGGLYELSLGARGH